MARALNLPAILRSLFVCLVLFGLTGCPDAVAPDEDKDAGVINNSDDTGNPGVGEDCSSDADCQGALVCDLRLSTCQTER